MSNRSCRTSQEGTGRGKRGDSARGGNGPSSGPPACTPQPPTLNVRLWQSQTSVGLGGGRPVQRPFGAGAVSGRKGSLLAAQIPAGYQPQKPSRQAPDFVSIAEPPLLQSGKSSRGRGNPLRLRRLLRGGRGGGASPGSRPEQVPVCSSSMAASSHLETQRGDIPVRPCAWPGGTEGVGGGLETGLGFPAGLADQPGDRASIPSLGAWIFLSLGALAFTGRGEERGPPWPRAAPRPRCPPSGASVCLL